MNELLELGDDFVLDLFQVFKKNSVLQANRMEAYASENNHVEIRKEAHALKSASASIGALRVSEICRSIENDTAADPAKIKALVGELLQELTAAVERLTEILK